MPKRPKKIHSLIILSSLTIMLPSFSAQVELLKDPNFSMGIKTNPLTVKTLTGTPDHRYIPGTTQVFYCGNYPPNFNPNTDSVWWFNQLGTFKDVYKHKIGFCNWDNGIGGGLMLPPANSSKALKLGLGSYRTFDNAFPRYWNETYLGPEGTGFKPKQYPDPYGAKSYTGVVIDPKDNDIIDFSQITNLQIPFGSTYDNEATHLFHSAQDKYIFKNYIGLAFTQAIASQLNDLNSYRDLVFSADVKLGDISHLADRLGVPGFRHREHGGSLIANLFFREKTPRVCSGISQPLRNIVLQVQFFSIGPYVGCNYDSAKDMFVKKPDYNSFKNQYVIFSPALDEACQKMGTRELPSGDPAIPNQVIYAIDSANYIRSNVPGSNRHLLIRGNDSELNDFATVRVFLGAHLQKAINYLNNKITAKDNQGKTLVCNPENMSNFKFTTFNVSWETNSLISGKAELKNFSVRGITK